MDTEYESQLVRARTMLAALGAMIEHHAQDQIRRKNERDYLVEIETLCTKLGEAAICITSMEHPR